MGKGGDSKMAIKDTYFTISEAAKELNVSRQTVYRWIADGKISTEKIGGVILVEKKAIRGYAAKKRFESFAGMMDTYLIDTVRKECGYTTKDIIEETKPGKGRITFLVTRKDGTREKVQVGGIEITIAMNMGEDSPRFKDMKLKDVIKAEYKQPKENKTISKPKTKAKEIK